MLMRMTRTYINDCACCSTLKLRTICANNEICVRALIAQVHSHEALTRVVLDNILLHNYRRLFVFLFILFFLTAARLLYERQQKRRCVHALALLSETLADRRDQNV